MKYYQGYWPVLAIIKQYLGNAKKRLVRDLKAEQADRGLPGSNANSKRRHKVKSRKTTASAKALEVEEESEDGVKASDEESESGNEEESENEIEDSEADEEVDSEDDEVELELYEHYTQDLGPRNERRSNDRPETSVEKAVEYQ